MNIGDEVAYYNHYGETLHGKLTAVGSDKDSYDDIKLKDGVFLYKSKKLKKYVPFKDKSLSSIYVYLEQHQLQVLLLLLLSLIWSFLPILG